MKEEKSQGVFMYVFGFEFLGNYYFNIFKATFIIKLKNLSCYLYKVHLNSPTFCIIWTRQRHFLYCLIFIHNYYSPVITTPLRNSYENITQGLLPWRHDSRMLAIKKSKQFNWTSCEQWSCLEKWSEIKRLPTCSTKPVHLLPWNNISIYLKYKISSY